MEFVGVLVFITLVGMIFNAYFLILPSLVLPSFGTKKHQIWIYSAVLAIISCCLFPISLFLIPSIIYTLNIFALCKSFSKGKGHKAVWIALEIFCLLLSPILAVYLFGFMFACNNKTKGFQFRQNLRRIWPRKFNKFKTIGIKRVFKQISH